MNYEVFINGTRRKVEFTRSSDRASQITFIVDGRRIGVDAIRILPGVYSILINGRSIEVTAEDNANGTYLRAAGRDFQVEVSDPRSWRGGRGGGFELEGRQQLVAPMPGKIVRVLTSVGQTVKSGDGLLVIEAMKMQNEIRSPKSGTVEKLAKEGQTVNAGEVLAVVS